MADANKKIIQFSDTTDADSLKNVSVASALFEPDVALFSPALLITHGGFDRDPAKEYHAFAPPDDLDQAPFYVDLPTTSRPFFLGLGNTAQTPYMPAANWDRRIYGIHVSRSEECFAFIRGIAFRQRSGRLYRSFSQPLLLSVVVSPGDIRRLPVTVFGVYTFCFVGADNPSASVTYFVPVNGTPTVTTNYFGTDDELYGFFARRGVVLNSSNDNEGE